MSYRVDIITTEKVRKLKENMPTEIFILPRPTSEVFVFSYILKIKIYRDVDRKFLFDE